MGVRHRPRARQHSSDTHSSPRSASLYTPETFEISYVKLFRTPKRSKTPSKNARVFSSAVSYADVNDTSKACDPIPRTRSP